MFNIKLNSKTRRVFKAFIGYEILRWFKLINSSRLQLYVWLSLLKLLMGFCQDLGSQESYMPRIIISIIKIENFCVT